MALVSKESAGISLSVLWGWKGWCVGGMGKDPSSDFNIIFTFCQVQYDKDFFLFYFWGEGGGGVMGKSNMFKLSMFGQTPEIQGSKFSAPAQSLVSRPYRADHANC